jgi:oxygen-independent coproporphyrinogen III oxidase
VAGIYIHIPFCKQQCNYCDFHFSTSLKNKNGLLQALLQEIEIRNSFTKGPKIKTIYFGGGTPSLLSGKELSLIFEQLNKHFEIESDAEITLEANPDDLNTKKIKELKNTPINRFSIGIQSFFDKDLQFMNRAHNSQEAERSIKGVQDGGWNNITIDLIYGTPTLNNEMWQENLEKFSNWNIPHLSAYGLTVEEKTPLFHAIKKGKTENLDQEKAKQQFELLMKFAKKEELEHYEISNFAKKGFMAKHNSSYWKGDSYLGLGPSAHSFDHNKRQWNIANNSLYIKAINERAPSIKEEILSEKEQFNEYIMVSLRTIWGCNRDVIELRFSSFLVDYFDFSIKKWIKNGKIKQNSAIFKLTQKGKILADRITSDLFYVD